MIEQQPTLAGFRKDYLGSIHFAEQYGVDIMHDKLEWHINMP